MADESPMFYSRAAILQSLASDPDPGDETVKLVAQVISDDRSLAEHFFRHLENPAWLEPLLEQGVFRKPPSCVQRASGVEYPPWGACSYLSRMAPIQPEMVVRVARAVETDNPRVYLCLIEAAVRMPPGGAAAIVPTVVGWLSKCDHWVDMLADAGQRLMVHLAQQKQVEPALALLEALTEPEIEERVVPAGEEATHVRRQASPRYRPWYFKQLVGNYLGALWRLDVLGVADVLEKQLRKSIEIEARQLPGGDGSYLWRRAVEDHAQNWGQEDLKNILTVGLRDTVEFAVRTQAEVARPIIERYLQDDLSIFRRLALHLLRVGGEHYRGLSSSVLQDTALRDDEILHHEYYRLLEGRFTGLPQEGQLRYLEWVQQGPDMEGFKNWGQAVTGQRPTDEDIGRHVRRWQLEQLIPVRDALSGDWSIRYEALVDEFGEPEHPGFRIWSSTTWVGPTSPAKMEELAAMGPADTLQYLKTFEPTGDFFDHSIEGLARELEAAVKQDPCAYLPIATGFLTERVHPTYLYHLVVGLHEAWKEGADLEWGQVVQLFELMSLVLTGDAPELLDAPIAFDDVDRRAVTAAVSRFLSGALHRDDRPFPDEMMPTIRDVLLRLVRDPDPTPEEEERRAGGAMDWVTVRINSARGVAASALLSWALRYARMHKAEHEAARTDEGYARRLEPTVREAFTRMLDKSLEPSAAVHSLFGEFLPNFLYLDHEWALSNLDRIFPAEPEQERYWGAAWEGYLLYSRPFYTEVYTLLRPQYWRALRAMVRRDTPRPMGWPEDYLAQHLAIAYTLGLEELECSPRREQLGFRPEDGTGSLLAAFLRRAPDTLRASLARSVGGRLRRDESMEPELWRRLIAYWASRAQVAENPPSGYKMDEELSAFASWLPGVTEGLDTLAPLLRATIGCLTTGHAAHEILEYLSKESDRHPRLAVEMLSRLLEREATLEREAAEDRIYLIGAEATIVSILRNALISDMAGRDVAISVINLLGERGDYRYRTLLTEPE